ncbi:hypothetical protein M407DRAFT_242957, partial [Tulasnella calospora MUT 4182]
MANERKGGCALVENVALRLKHLRGGRGGSEPDRIVKERKGGRGACRKRGASI